jgi:hypothetical protein
MLGARHASLQPSGLKQLVLADTPADIHEWADAQRAVVQ